MARAVPKVTQVAAKDFMMPMEQLLCVSRTDTLHAAMELMIACNYARRRCYVIEGDRCIGMLGMARLTTAWHESADPKTTPVQRYMRDDFAVAGPAASLEQCSAVMGRRRLHHLVITDNGQPGGKMLGGMTAWLVAQEQSVQTMAYPHNQIARRYQQFWRPLPAKMLRVKPAEGAANAKL